MLATEDDLLPKIVEKPLVNWEHEELATVRIKVLRGHTDSVNSCEYFDNDQKIFTSSSDKSVRVWEVESGNIIHSFYTGHTDIVSEARFNGDGSRFVTSSWDKSVKMFDAETAQELWMGSHEGMVTCCKFSSDGKMVMSCSDLDNALKIWDANSGKLIFNLPDYHKNTITSCIFTPDCDKAITTSADKTTKFFDLMSGKSTIQLEGHINLVSCCDITKDERKFATGSWDKNVKIWDVATGGYRSNGPGLLTGSHEGSISCCCFSDNGLMLVTGSYDQTVVVWDVENEIQKIRLQGHEGWVNDVRLSQDKKWVISCSKDCTVRFWNIEDSDKIPIVIERKKAIGLKVSTCEKCGKMYSVAGGPDQSITMCVFCRTHSAEKSMSSVFMNLDKGSAGSPDNES